MVFNLFSYNVASKRDSAEKCLPCFCSYFTNLMAHCWFSGILKTGRKSCLYKILTSHIKANIFIFIFLHSEYILFSSFSRLDYCSIIFTGQTEESIRQPQLIVNAAARVFTKTKNVDHITPVLRSVHWLPVHHTIDFKILLLV